MKRFFVLTAVCAAMFMMVSCGGSNDSNSDSGDSGNADISDTGDKTDSDTSDSSADTGDHGDSASDTTDDTTDTGNQDKPDTGDEEECYPLTYQCRDGNSYKCNLDLVWELAEECVNGCREMSGKCYSELKDCSDSEKEVCLDKKTGLFWSKKSPMMTWENAGNYCEDLEENSFDDWRLPTIDELRTLILSCEASVPGGTCPVSEEADVLDSASWSDACHCEDAPSLEGYTKFGEEDYYEFLWSSSEVTDKEDLVWILETRNANVRTERKDEETLEVARCVRSAE